MEKIYERIAYLRGLAEGLSVDRETKEGILFEGIIDCLENLTFKVEGMKKALADVEDYAEHIDDDLSDVEDAVYGEPDFDYDEDIDYDYDGDFDPDFYDDGYYGDPEEDGEFDLFDEELYDEEKNFDPEEFYEEDRLFDEEDGEEE